MKLIGFLCLAAGGLAFFTARSIGWRSAERAAVEIRPAQAIEEPPAGAASEWLTEYELTERSGRTFASQELGGKVHVVSFFFASCPTVCRLQNGRVAELAREFGPEGVVFVSITVDPKNDTPATLQTYAKGFEADPEDWLFLTSTDLLYLRRVGSEVYGLPTDEQVHSERLVVVDRSGEIRGRFHWNKPEEIDQMRQMLRELQAEPAELAGSESTDAEREAG